MSKKAFKMQITAALESWDYFHITKSSWKSKNNTRWLKADTAFIVDFCSVQLYKITDTYYTSMINSYSYIRLRIVDKLQRVYTLYSDIRKSLKRWQSQGLRTVATKTNISV